MKSLSSLGWRALRHQNLKDKKMTTFTLLTYDIPTKENDSRELDDFRNFIKEELFFKRLQDSVYINYDGYNEWKLKNKIMELSEESDVRIVKIELRQLDALRVNKRTGKTTPLDSC